ncbi:TPA: hypothetical protein N0F65_008263, partial [Lagenidium giganteum]
MLVTAPKMSQPRSRTDATVAKPLLLSTDAPMSSSSHSDLSAPETSEDETSSSLSSLAHSDRSSLPSIEVFECGVASFLTDARIGKYPFDSGRVESRYLKTSKTALETLCLTPSQVHLRGSKTDQQGIRKDICFTKSGSRRIWSAVAALILLKNAKKGNHNTEMLGNTRPPSRQSSSSQREKRRCDGFARVRARLPVHPSTWAVA